jgi:HSP20 family protein
MPQAPRSLFEDVFREPMMTSRRRLGPSAAASGLPLDAYVTEREIVVQAAFPGVAPENVQITVENDTLTLTAELPEPLENVNYVFAERSHGRVSRQLALNVPVDLDKAEATFEHGLLTLTLPKADVARPKTITVTGK